MTYHRAVVCQDPDTCGGVRSGGRPPHGWVQVHIAINRGGDRTPIPITLDPWFCSWACLALYARSQALATGQIAREPATSREHP